MAGGINNRRAHDTGQAPESLFCPPETAAAEQNLLLIGFPSSAFRGRPQHLMGGFRGDGRAARQGFFGRDDPPLLGLAGRLNCSSPNTEQNLLPQP